jgi:hypothetical protein
LRRRSHADSPIKKHLYLLARLSRWLGEQGLDATDVATERVEVSFAARRAAGVANLRTTRSLAPFIAHLHQLGGAATLEVPSELTASQRLVLSFGTYLARERGLAGGTIRFYVHIARLFVGGRPGGADFCGLSAREVTAFTATVCEGRGWSSCRQAVSALRSFLRFLAVEGLAGAALEEAVLPVAGPSCPLPRAISAGAVTRLLSSCEQNSAAGRRDYAILLLLARLAFGAAR